MVISRSTVGAETDLSRCCWTFEVRGRVSGLADRARRCRIVTPPMIGRIVSHYRIEAKLGEGGMGTVYRAHDLTLNRNAAIKFLSTDVADEQHRLRFQQEAQAASSLNHPHILTVHEAGTI